MLVNADDLSAYLGGPIWTPLQRNHIETVVLPGVQQELENWLNRPVEPTQVREARPVDCNGIVWLTVSPVWQVLSIDYGTGTTPTTPDQYVPGAMGVTAVADRRWDPAGAGVQGAPWMAAQPGYLTVQPPLMFPNGYQVIPTVVVTYIGGYNGYVDQALKLDIERVAAREVERLYDNSLSLRDGAGQPAGMSDQRDKGWTDGELAKWTRLRRPVVAT
jgi:hypothetical protein